MRGHLRPPLRAARAYLALLVLAVALPAAAQDPATPDGGGRAVLYVHVGDPANTDDIPLSARAPPPDFVYRSPVGAQSTAFSCPTVPPGGIAQESHRFYGVAYARAVAYESGNGSLRPEAVLYGAARGVAYGANITAAPTLTWYLETSAPFSEEPYPGPVANVVVKATLREGEEAGAGPAGYDAGLLIAEGQSAPALLAGPQSQGVTVHTVDGRPVYNVTVPLTLASPRIPDVGFNLRVEILVDNPACATVGGSAALPLLRLHSSEGLRPRLELGVAEAMRVGPLAFDRDQFGTVRLTAPVLPVWGGYALGNASAQATGPGAITDTYATLFVPSVGCPDACGRDDGLKPQDPAYFFWGWRVRNDEAPPGAYNVTLTAVDVAGNEARAASGFVLPASLTETLQPTSAEPAVALGAPHAALLLLLAGLLPRYRKRA